MGVQISSKLGVISCPGGEVFAKSVVEHLTRLFQRDLKRKTNDLVKKYGISKEEVVRRFNLDADLAVRPRVSKGSPDEYAIPRFNIPVEFTRFDNGEFKATILSSVRGADLYIFQDVENQTRRFRRGRQPLLWFCRLIRIRVSINARGAKR